MLFETSARNYESWARKIPKEGVFNLHRGGSLKSLSDFVCLPL